QHRASTPMSFGRGPRGWPWRHDGIQWLRAHAPQRQGRPVRRHPLHPAPRRSRRSRIRRVDRRLHGEIDMIPPVEPEDIYHHHQTVPATADAALASLQPTWRNSRGDRAEHRRGARRDSAERAHREDENCADQGQQAPEQEQRREVPTPVVAEQREGEHQRRYRRHEGLRKGVADVRYPEVAGGGGLFGDHLGYDRELDRDVETLADAGDRYADEEDRE